MTAMSILCHLQASGFTLLATGQQLAVTPASKLTEAERALVARHKEKLLALLAPKPCAQCATPMTHIEAGYYSCPACHYQIVEAKSGYFHKPAETQPEGEQDER